MVSVLVCTSPRAMVVTTSGKTILTAYQAIVDEGITFIDTAEVRHALQHASDCTQHTKLMPCDTWKG